MRCCLGAFEFGVNLDLKKNTSEFLAFFFSFRIIIKLLRKATSHIGGTMMKKPRIPCAPNHAIIFNMTLKVKEATKKASVLHTDQCPQASRGVDDSSMPKLPSDVTIAISYETR